MQAPVENRSYTSQDWRLAQKTSAHDTRTAPGYRWRSIAQRERSKLVTTVNLRAAAEAIALQQLTHRTRRLGDREMRIGVATGVGIGDGDATERLPRRSENAVVVVVGIEQ